ncbi:GNAT family N-acetyltransferase [Microvirga tunisiensis]|uniref:GNAT family N-acetyltransferase n=1 Tax=Pannonibacter tanglangensis TaxID=2750084 RepID=A0A7X5EZ94_9HYPH|nr:N-acetyltransferase [Pannonibacter sp. XCT-53]NBN76863.1 GNAT family N-acetyltransferase [Pannonibacter sp. XCT-53]
MKADTWFIRLEHACDEAAVDALQAAAFGPGRFARTAFRIREGVPQDDRLCFVGLAGDQVAGSVRLTPIRIGTTPAQLLGPLTVAPEYKNRGLGRLLMRTALDEARRLGETAVLLVGDPPYYGPFGFEHVPLGRIVLPGPVDPNRLLVAMLDGAPMPEGPVRGGR